MITNAYNLDRLRAGIKPFRLHWYSRLRSTNNHAALLRKRERLFAPAAVLTGNQMAGRGRNGNTWWSSAGSLTVTFVLPIDDERSPHQLPLIAGLAVRNAVAEITANKAVQLKWPNDLIYRDRKLAGLLCERVHKADLIGLGLNINAEANVPKSLRKSVISMSEIAGEQFDKTDVLIAVIRHLYPMIAHRREHPFATVLREYDRHHALPGRRLTIIGADGEAPIEGICRGLDSLGRMLMQSRGQMHRIVAGHVVLKS